MKVILGGRGEIDYVKNNGDKTYQVEYKGYEFKVDEINNETTYVRKVEIGKANRPNISGFSKSTTYYVTWEGSTINDGTPISSGAPSGWYDYTAGTNEWANVKTTGGGNDCYWVWIPRYSYKVPTRSKTASTIEVKFLRGTSDNPVDGSTIQISNNTAEGSWNVHPAFWWDKNDDGIRTPDEELSGIWVAKFEASSSSATVVENPTLAELANNGGGNTTGLQVRVKPNVTSWRSITVNNIFTVCQNLTKSGNSLEGSSNIDSHMMKNSEWGAVAYLSRSVYGKNSKVWNNPWAVDNTTYYSPVTGRASKNSGNPDAFLNGEDVANADYLAVTDAYNTGNGPQSSTTGNVYGVYDMAGGAWEYTAGILSELTANANYSILTTIGNKKYTDNYAGISGTDTENYALSENQAKYGDAVYETSTAGNGSNSWDGDFSYFPYSSLPVFHRGGRASDGSSAGVFAFARHTGGTNIIFSFRPCLVSP